MNRSSITMRTLCFTAVALCALNTAHAQETKAKIRVANVDETTIYSNATCIGSKTGKTIKAANAMAGFSSWRKSPKVVGMPSLPDTPKENSEYEIDAGVPTILQMTHSSQFSHTITHCVGTNFAFIPQAGHSYEAWVRVGKQYCDVTFRDLVANPQTNTVEGKPIRLYSVITCDEAAARNAAAIKDGK